MQKFLIFQMLDLLFGIFPALILPKLFLLHEILQSQVENQYLMIKM